MVGEVLEDPEQLGVEWQKRSEENWGGRVGRKPTKWLSTEWRVEENC